MLRPITTVLAAALVLLALAAPASAQSPNWPENGWAYACTYTLNGNTGYSTIFFKQLWANPHVYPDGNQLKRGRLVTILPNNTLDQGVALAWKPAELPDPPGGTNLELTLDNGIQCKRFENYGDFYLSFSQCSNGIVQTCTLIY